MTHHNNNYDIWTSLLTIWMMLVHFTAQQINTIVSIALGLTFIVFNIVKTITELKSKQKLNLETEKLKLETEELKKRIKEKNGESA